MNTKELEILTNIIGAVESGGQIYGNRKYSAYAGAYANSNKEHTCTLGWAQNYGYEAMKLCKNIFAMDKNAFRKADTANIEFMLNVDWVATRWNPNSSQKKALIAIITTDAGKKCQDELFHELMNAYIKDALKFDKSMSISAQMMWCEIAHLGGSDPVVRIFNRAKKPYTPDSIYASLILDQNDTSNDNQVGDKKFQSRHQCCVEWIKQYVTNNTVKEEVNVGVTEQQVIGIMDGWKGMSRSAGTHKPIVDTYNSHKPLARGYAVTYKDDYCDTTVSAAFIKACKEVGINVNDVIGGTECGVEEHVKIFQRFGIWEEDGSKTPKVGWICVYNWDDSTQPNDGWSDHIGIVKSVKSNTFIVIEGNMSGGIVGEREVKIGWGYIRGFAKPKYAAVSTPVPTPQPVNPTPAPSTPKKLKATSNSKFAVSGTGTPNKTQRYVGTVVVGDDILNVRSWAGTKNPNIKSYPRLANGNKVSVCDAILADDGSNWYYVKIADKYYGFVHSGYVSIS